MSFLENIFQFCFSIFRVQWVATFHQNEKARRKGHTYVPVFISLDCFVKILSGFLGYWCILCYFNINEKTCSDKAKPETFKS